MTPLVDHRRQRGSSHNDELLSQGDLVSKLILFGAALLSLVLLAVTAAYPQPAANQNAPTYTEAELDQMLAPIALYPDDLLAQVLMASTYPLEIVEAERWVKQNEHPKSDALAAALQNQPWDPSVKSIVPFPQVLALMNDKLSWTQKLGDAFLSQQKDVMASVQRLRQRANSAGKLKSNAQQKVVTEQKDIIIQPADPQVVYVPAYDPSVVYGAWPYPAYPPYYYAPPAMYYPGAAFATGMAFAAGIAVTSSIWGWGHCNWGGGTVNVNVNQFNTINANNIRAGRATQVTNNNWRRDPARSVNGNIRNSGNFRNAAAGTGVGGARAGQSRANQYRGYENRGAGQAGRNNNGAGRSQLGQNGAGRSQFGQNGAGRQNQARSNSAFGRQGAGANTSGLNRSTAFSGMNSGFSARAESQRGLASRQSFNRSEGGLRNFGGGGHGVGGGGGRGFRGGGRGRR